MINTTVKLPSLKTPIEITPASVADHVLRQPPDDDVTSARFQEALSARMTERLAADRQLIKGPLLDPPPQVTFDVEGFLTDLAEELGNHVEGFAIHIQYPDPSNAQNSLQDSRVGGWAIDPADQGSVAWSTQCPMHVASVSKLVTAVAMTRALRDYEIPADTAIGGWLPPFWAQGPNIGNVTFAQLLTHKSGIPQGTGGATDYTSMEALVNTGVEASAIGIDVYANMNFSLCRMLLATILMLVVSYEKTGVPAGDQPGGIHTPVYGGPFPHTDVPIGTKRVVTFVDQWPEGDAARDLFSIQAYKNYVVEKVLTGNETARFSHAAGDALAYANPKPPITGWNSGDLSTCVGAAGWHFSTTDLLSFMGDFRRGGLILSQAEAQEMLDASFGIDWTQDAGAGNFYEKNGDWGNVQNQEEVSTVFFLPKNTELVVLINSQLVGLPAVGGYGPDLPGTVASTYAAHLIPV